MGLRMLILVIIYGQNLLASGGLRPPWTPSGAWPLDPTRSGLRLKPLKRRISQKLFTSNLNASRPQHFFYAMSSDSII